MDYPLFNLNQVYALTSEGENLKAAETDDIYLQIGTDPRNNSFYPILADQNDDLYFVYKDDPDKTLSYYKSKYLQELEKKYAEKYNDWRKFDHIEVYPVKNNAMINDYSFEDNLTMKELLDKYEFLHEDFEIEDQDDVTYWFRINTVLVYVKEKD